MSRAGMHLRAALRHLGYCLSDLVGWQREPIAVELAPDTDGDLHPATLCKCEVGTDAPPERHAEGCLWAAVMCRHCAGLGQCLTCSGDGISPDPDNAGRDEFSRALLALFDAAHELTLPEPDGTSFCGAAKDLLLALGMTWDENAQKYRLAADAQERS